MCEGVGDDSGHGIGHVDIRVGSCNWLNEFVCHICALRWGVTQVGNYLYWALLTISRDHHLKVQGAIGKATLTRGRVLEESRLVALVLLCMTCIRIL